MEEPADQVYRDDLQWPHLNVAFTTLIPVCFYFCREFGLRMTISHQRRRSAKETEFQCTAPTLQCRLSALQDSVARSAESCLSGVRVPAENFYLSRGVWFEGLLDAALAQSVDRKLLHLQRRLYSSLSALNDSLVTVRHAFCLSLLSYLLIFNDIRLISVILCGEAGRHKWCRGRPPHQQL